MCVHGSGMATPSVDLVSGSASTFADSAVSRAYDACHTLHAPTCLTSDKGLSVNFVGLDFAGLVALWSRNPAYLLRPTAPGTSRPGFVESSATKDSGMK
jgi:hypothetical protein